MNIGVNLYTRFSIINGKLFFRYKPELSAVVWNIKAFPGGKEYLMRCQMNLPSVEGDLEEKKRPIEVKFEIPYFTTSGIQVSSDVKDSQHLNIVINNQSFIFQVRYLKIIEKSGYQALPWVRYITQNGDYELRTNGANNV